MATLHALIRTTARKKLRVGRGGKRGKTAGRGTKGQNARAGRKKRPEWRDIIKKIPKRRGFGKNRGRTVNPLRVKPVAVSLKELSRLNAGEITIDALKVHGVLSRKGKRVAVKLIGNGPIEKAFKVRGMSATPGAQAALEKAGGSISL